jgi:hypothetical protein
MYHHVMILHFSPSLFRSAFTSSDVSPVHPLIKSLVNEARSVRPLSASNPCKPVQLLKESN